MQKSVLILVVGPLLSLVTQSPAAAASSPREEIIPIVAEIRRADYEGDRPALKKSYDRLAPYLEEKEIASRVRYWRGFALWRSAINGANEPSMNSTELEKELAQAVEEFKEALAKDPAFVDAKVGMISCLGFTAYFHRQEKERSQALLAQIFPLVKEAKAAAPDNPRLLWVMGPILWYTPVDRGGGIDKAIENYERGLSLCSQVQTADDNLEPSWGKPELLMSLAYTHLQKNPPDVTSAERSARAALEAVPYWHYLRDILLPQIAAAKTKATEMANADPKKG